PATVGREPPLDLAPVPGDHPHRSERPMRDAHRHGPVGPDLAGAICRADRDDRRSRPRPRPPLRRTRAPFGPAVGPVGPQQGDALASARQDQDGHQDDERYSSALLDRDAHRHVEEIPRRRFAHTDSEPERSGSDTPSLPPRYQGAARRRRPVTSRNTLPAHSPLTSGGVLTGPSSSGDGLSARVSAAFPPGSSRPPSVLTGPTQVSGDGRSGGPVTMDAMTEQKTPTFYDEIGGHETFTRLVKRFYEGVATDPV